MRKHADAWKGLGACFGNGSVKREQLVIDNSLWVRTHVALHNYSTRARVGPIFLMDHQKLVELCQCLAWSGPDA